MQEDLVSVIMNCHNSDKYLKESIKSVLSQTYKNWELIFWDNNSTDNSANIFKSYKDKRFKYFYSNIFTTLGEARNLAIKNSKGKYIAFLDCDDIWYPNKLCKQIPLFSDLEVGIVISNTKYFSDEKYHKVLYGKNKPKQGYVFDKLLESYFISLETVIIKRSFLEKLDEYFDNRFEVIEEFDLLVRLSQYCKLAYVDEVLGKWRIHKNSLTSTRPDLFPLETRLFIDKLSKKIPKLNIRYKKSILKLILNIENQEFQLLWRDGKHFEARRKIRKYILCSKKLMLIYLLSYFIPYRVFEYINKKKLNY